MDERTLPMRRGAGHPHELVAGEVIGNWRKIRKLGTGGFATVYEVQHVDDGTRAALKILHAQLVTSSQVLARFEREIHIIQRLANPAIVQLIDAGFTGDGRPYLCMDLLEGEELSNVIATRGRLRPDEALAVLGPLCDALAAAHALGIVHRDIKAANVMVCGEHFERVVLLDFGIAKISDAFASELTATNQSLGTPTNMAPEQFLGQVIDGRADVYALGCLAFHMVTGRVPFDDESSTMMQYLHLHARRPQASLLASVPHGLDDVIARAMAIEPADRFADPSAFLVALVAAVQDHATVREEVDSAAILVSVESASVLDDALLSDVEAVLPAAERSLAASGFALALELGSSAIFVKPRASAAEATQAAVSAWHALDGRSQRDDRVKIGLCVHLGTATFVGTEVRSPTLLHPATWPVPEPFEGLWVDGKRIR